MAAGKKNYRRIYDLQKELNERGTIPTIYQTTFEDRLSIAFRSLDRVERKNVARSSQEIKLRSMERGATRVYLKILEIDPHI
jgi:hypothetical protein